MWKLGKNCKKLKTKVTLVIIQNLGYVRNTRHGARTKPFYQDKIEGKDY